MNKIILHWTAGTNQPCSTDYEHYHYLINKDGVILKGKFTPEDNLNCNDGKYAQHCGGGNTGAIGVSMCGMYVPKGVNIKDTKFPLTRIQCEAAFKLIAELCKKYICGRAHHASYCVWKGSYGRAADRRAVWHPY